MIEMENTPKQETLRIIQKDGHTYSFTDYGWTLMFSDGDCSIYRHQDSRAAHNVIKTDRVDCIDGVIIIKEK